MIIALLISQILIQLIVYGGHSTLTYICLYSAYLLSVLIMQARWCAVWSRYDELDMRLDKLKAKKNKRDKERKEEHYGTVTTKRTTDIKRDD